MDDEKIIELFFERSEQAIKELDGKYGKVFHSLSFKILNNRQDAEECVNDAYLGTWNAIPPAKPNPLLAFVCKITRNISLKRYEQNTAIKRNSHYDIVMEELEDCLTSSTAIEEEIAERELTRIISIYQPVQLRDTRRTSVNSMYSAMNLGESKGLTFERVLIYPTSKMLDWILDHNKKMKPQSKSKFYVGVTRAKHSVAIVFDNKKGITIPGIINFTL